MPIQLFSILIPIALIPTRRRVLHIVNIEILTPHLETPSRKVRADPENDIRPSLVQLHDIQILIATTSTTQHTISMLRMQ